METNGRNVLYSRNVYQFSGYYIKAILSRLLKEGVRVASVFTDDTLDGFVEGVSVYPTGDFHEVGRESVVYICERNPVYAEDTKESLLAMGYQNVKLPGDFGMECSKDRFDTIEFNLNIGCSLNCLYCPQKKIIHSYLSTARDKRKLHWSFKDFCDVVCNRMNPSSTVGFSGMSEPFENSEAVEMICYAYQTGHPIMLNTTLMGLTLPDFEKLRQTVKKFERVLLHVPDERGNSHFKIDDEYKKILRLFIEAYQQDIGWVSSHGKPSREIVEILQPYDIFVQSDPEVSFSDRAGNLEGVKVRVSPPPRTIRKNCLQFLRRKPFTRIGGHARWKTGTVLQ